MACTTWHFDLKSKHVLVTSNTRIVCISVVSRPHRKYTINKFTLEANSTAVSMPQVHRGYT